MPEIVMLHDGLGSIDQWRSVPGALAAATHKTVLAYERAGHGESLPTPMGAWPADWLHHEADVLAQLLDHVGARRPILVGHSDGGSIALLHAAAAGDAVGAVVALAAHSWVEQVCFDSIVGMRANRAPIVAALSRFHTNANSIFEAWSGVWVSDSFRDWDIRPRLAAITAPTLIAQGRDDAYATDAHATATAAAVGSQASCVLIDDVGHIMHHDDPDGVVSLICDFVASM